MNVHISIIIPAYNEEQRIVSTLDSIKKYLKRQKYSSEIIVVDDGSVDNTKNILKKIKNIILVSYKKNKGKGYAIKKGVEKAKGKYILYMDADGAIPVKYLSDFLKFIDNYDIVIAVKRLKLNLRSFVSFCLRIFPVIFLNLNDSQTGFKLFKRESAKKLFKNLKTYRWAFDFEILKNARKRNLKIKQVEVKIADNSRSHVKILDLFRFLFDILKILFRKQ